MIYPFENEKDTEQYDSDKAFLIDEAKEKALKKAKKGYPIAGIRAKFAKGYGDNK